MGVEITSKRLTARVGDKIVVTNIDVCQRTLPAKVQFADIEEAVHVNKLFRIVDVEFEGYERSVDFSNRKRIPATARRQLAQEVADLLAADGVVVEGRPVE